MRWIGPQFVANSMRQTFRSLKHKRTFSAMQSELKSNHVDRTADNTRQEIVSLATVIGMRDESKTVKSLALHIQNKDLTFKAGQWLDVFIPGVETVGGFSMCSSPVKLVDSGQLDLAVKFSKHPPAHWIHTQCRVGSKLAVRVGGDFYFDPVTHGDRDLLLIAGGVGINPVLSILNHVTDLQKGDKSGATESVRRVVFLYSSKTSDELIFKDQLDAAQQSYSNVQCQYYITREETATGTSSQSSTSSNTTTVTGKRISAENITKCFDWLRLNRTLAYICGPSSMLTDMEQDLLHIGIDKDNIKYEKWW